MFGQARGGPNYNFWVFFQDFRGGGILYALRDRTPKTGEFITPFSAGQKGASGKGPRQKTSKSVKNVFWHFARRAKK